jgi:hypothetical protein
VYQVPGDRLVEADVQKVPRTLSQREGVSSPWTLKLSGCQADMLDGGRAATGVPQFGLEA